MFDFSFFILVDFFLEIKYIPIVQILYMIKDFSFFELNDKDEIIQQKKKIVLQTNNKEMEEVINLFNYLVKIALLKINFEQNNNNEKITSIKEDDHINSLDDYMDLIVNINNKEIFIMISFIISNRHFKKGLYKLAENEFKELIKELNIYTDKLNEEKENDETNLKDTISRFSKISYLNEYSLTNELSENTLHIVKMKLLSQKIYYLYGLNIYNQEKKQEYNHKKYNQENGNKKYEEAIKYFLECKNISSLLGIDLIRQIFSLIMISKCYLEIKRYKESMENINEALFLFSDIQKAFKDKPYFIPKIMIFIENYIFQYIMLTMAQTTFNFNKYSQSCWILMKMIESCPFVFDNIHFQTCYLLSNCFNKFGIGNNLPLRQIDKYKNKVNKILSRISVGLFNKEKNLIINTNSSIATMNNINSSISKRKLTRSINKFTNKISISASSLVYIGKRKINKNITLCISEKVLEETNGDVLKNVILKFFKKCFSNGNEEDKFAFIQFSRNGKKTTSIKPSSLKIFLQNLEISKVAFKVCGLFVTNNPRIQFVELSNLFMDVIKSDKQTNYEDMNDNIIILFINTSDIRFNNHKECVDTINELNNNNYTVIIFTYDFEIDEEKINGIYSFINGLNDGHFFRVINYQQIKQVLMNFASNYSQEKFSNYNFKISDFML